MIRRWMAGPCCVCACTDHVDSKAALMPAIIFFVFWSYREKTVANVKRMTNLNKMNGLYYQRLTICVCVPFKRTSSGFKRPVFIPHAVNSSLISCLTFGCSYVLVSSEGHIHGCVVLTNNRRLWCGSNQPNGSKGLTHKDKKKTNNVSTAPCSVSSRHS